MNTMKILLIHVEALLDFSLDLASRSEHRPYIVVQQYVKVSPQR